MSKFGFNKKDIKVTNITIFKEQKVTMFKRVKEGTMIKSHQIENINNEKL